MRQTASRRNRFQARTTFLTVPLKRHYFRGNSAIAYSHILAKMKKNVRIFKKALDPSMVLRVLYFQRVNGDRSLVPVALLLFLNQFEFWKSEDYGMEREFENHPILGESPKGKISEILI